MTQFETCSFTCFIYEGEKATGLFINYNQAKTNIEKFNAKELKEKMPDIYDEFVSFDGKRASYITIKY